MFVKYSASLPSTFQMQVLFKSRCGRKSAVGDSLTMFTHHMVFLSHTNVSRIINLCSK